MNELIPYNEYIKIVEKFIITLYHLEQRGIYHKDLKLSSIFYIIKLGKIYIKLADFIESHDYLN